MPNAQADQTSISRTAVFGLSSGILVIIATLVAVGLLNVPRPAEAGGPSLACPQEEVSVDQGYGIGPTAFQTACRDPSEGSLAGNAAAR